MSLVYGAPEPDADGFVERDGLYVPDGCVAWWDPASSAGMGKLYDRVSGYPVNLNGTISGALWAGGPTGATLSFDGVDDYCKILGDPIGTGAISIEALVYLNGYGGNGIGRILDNGTCFLYIGNATQKKVNFIRSGFSSATNRTKLALGYWYHILVTSTITGLTIIYVNGLSDHPVGETYGAPAAGFDTYIGNRAELDREFDGKIALVRVYNKVLTASEAHEAFRDVAPLAGLG